MNALASEFIALWITHQHLDRAIDFLCNQMNLFLDWSSLGFARRRGIFDPSSELRTNSSSILIISVLLFFLFIFDRRCELNSSSSRLLLRSGLLFCRTLFHCLLCCGWTLLRYFLLHGLSRVNCLGFSLRSLLWGDRLGSLSRSLLGHFSWSWFSWRPSWERPESSCLPLLWLQYSSSQ